MAAEGLRDERGAGAGGEINVVAGGAAMETTLVSARGPPRSVAITR
jgi:hypothetical protein